MPSLKLFLSRFLKRFFPSLQVFQREVFKSFWAKRFYLYLFLKGWKNQRKRKSLGIDFDLYLYFYLEFFPRVFLCDFDFQTLYFLTLELSIFPIYQDLVLVRNLVCGLLRPPSVITFFVLLSLLCRGDCGGCVAIPLVKGGCVGFVSIPLVRGDCCLAQCPIPLLRD